MRFECSIVAGGFASRRMHRSWSGPGLVATLLLSLGLCSIPAIARGGSERRSWRVKYELGTERVQEGAKLDLTVNEGTVVIKARNKTRLSIPKTSLVSVMYDTLPHRPLDELQVPPGSAWKDVDLALTTVESLPSLALLAGGLSQIGLMFVPVAFVLCPPILFDWVESISSLSTQAREANDRFVYLVWRDQRTVKDLLMRIDSQEHCSSLLAAIREASGRDFVDLPAYRERLIEELAARPRWSVPLEAKGTIRAGGRDLSPRRYTLVLWEGEEREGRVFLFSGDRLRLKELSALVPVTIETAGTKAAVPEVAYKEADGFTAISAIGLEDKVLHFPDEPTPGEPRMISYGGAPALRFEAGNHALDVITLASYRGESAVRFPMFRRGATDSRGFLYVTPSRIAYDPVMTPRRRKPFDASRSDVKSLACPEDFGGGYHLRIELGHDRLALHPIGQGLDMRPSTAKRVRLVQRGFCELILEAFNDFQAVEARLTQGPK